MSRHGIGLGGVLLIGGLAVYSGAGTKIGGGLGQLEGACYDKLGAIANGAAMPACRLVGGAVRGIDTLSYTIGIYASQAKTAVIEHVRGASERTQSEGLAHFNSMLESGAGSGAWQSLGSSATELAKKIKQGPAGLADGAGGQLRNAVDSFTIGQQVLSGGGSATQALPWLQQGAATPGYGVLSQMQLGDMYAQGAGDVAPNPELAAGYYAQASQSITALQASGSVEAKQMLQSLHAAPQQIQQQLQAAIAQLNGKR